ncbi:MAG TPA: hypothetical protein VKT73_07305 [Xanthobacteraceae bacterium]|nr:hypothetical protein [Xanthobacteraceae bacterium]
MAIYRLLKNSVSFEPETVQAMCSAYEDVCKQLELSNETDDRMTEFVALMVIEVAKSGERDAGAIRERVLRLLGIIRFDPQR